MTKLAEKLEAAAIDYCIMGGNALHVHGYTRATVDVDVLLTAEGRDQFVELYVGRGFTPRFRGAKTKFRSTVDGVPIDILISGTFPGNEQTTVAFPHPAEISYDENYDGLPIGRTVKFVDLKNLINLKLISYADLPDNRMQDFVDVNKLIENNPHLDDAYSEQLHPMVRENYKKALRIAMENLEARDRD
eukprot:CAMPEP_0119005832 /NCGR_PEP_ID=MMETSP1176-20130426/1953_1 /TAXON_ID=265551 /ORGANISM="Synedropsis recta cf, Strain CCMP1620" /LENGTH=188 /DNA_ID=CAMNT_0006957681 /DNA_START=183 /DNA_END=749 /DNA_ORIENTATION=+